LVKKKAKKEAGRQVHPKQPCPAMTVMTFVVNADEIFKIRNQAAGNEPRDGRLLFQKIMQGQNSGRV
jgi:hypothetical protein